MSKLKYILAILIFSGLFFSGCSTKKNKLINRSFHNLTARYNGYFYAEESIKDGVMKIEKAHKENYTQVLPVFIYIDAQNAKNIYPEMDRAIKKASTVIQRHTITDRKEKEIVGAVKWTDENYMAIGRAHFYKHDFFSAIEAFDYVSKAYKESPTRYLAMMWMIRSYNEIGSFSMAQPIIDQLNADKEFPKNFNAEYSAVLADYYIKRENYESAIKNISKAAVLTKNKKRRTRYTYILAQLYEKSGDEKNASTYYNRVIALHPQYEMTFNAKIKVAKLYDVKSGDSKEIKKILTKMLKDEKNKEYQDQIYYSMAEIELKENNKPKAIEYLKTSVVKSINNNNQKALSYLKLGEIYFANPDYKNAGAYFDSTMLFLANDFPDYEAIKERKNSLGELVANLNIIQLEDSLLKLGAMSEEDRNKAIDKLIAKVEAEEKKKKEEEEQQLLNNTFTNNQTTQQINSTSTQWYFYNPSMVSFGKSDFAKTWGQRKLEDNWRRINKESTLSFFDPNQEDGDTISENNNSKTVVTANQRKTRDFYLKDIPLTEKAREKSNQRIVNSYYTVGTLYKERFNDNQKASETLEELLKRYPKNKFELSSYYLLYRIYLASNNTAKADYYKNILLNDYPDTEYARIIKNPDYNKQIMASKNVVENFYAQTFELYQQGRYMDVIAHVRTADSLYAKSFLAPNFDFLGALSIGRTQSINNFEKALTQVILKYPKHEISNKAQEMLDLVKQQKSNSAAAIDSTKKYIFEKDGNYFWIVLVKNKKGNMDKFKIKLSDFNSKYYSLAGLTVNSNLLNEDTQMISIKTFEGKEKAMDYYNAIDKEAGIFNDLEANSYVHFIITSANYSTLYKEKNVEDYRAFFKENYLPK